MHVINRENAVAYGVKGYTDGKKTPKSLVIRILLFLPALSPELEDGSSCSGRFLRSLTERSVTGTLVGSPLFEFAPNPSF